VAVRARSRARDRAGRVAVRSGAGASAREPEGRGVPDIQRARMIAALVEVARERGAARVTVAHVVARSGVSRRTFYEMFADRDACFLAAMELAIERAAARVLPAFEQVSGGARKAPGGARLDPGDARLAPAGVGRTPGGGRQAPDGARRVFSGGRQASGGVRLRANRARWREQVRAGLAALLEFLDDEPGPGGLCVVDTLSAGPQALRLRAQIVGVLVDAVDAGRGEAKAGLAPSRLTAEGVVGGVLAVLYARMAEPTSEPMLKLLNPLMAMIVLPYLGPAAAAREGLRVLPRARPRPQSPASNPLEGLGMRLTYRTVRVLGAVAACPGASNRQIADASGVQDQGQISKLLVRLERLGLVVNASSGPMRGEPNAWQLTAKGREVEQAIRAQSTPIQA
jgi:AcrR family transcriptional regulator/DNA-binding MarR family transcriptional regulator